MSNKKHGTAISWTHGEGYKGETWNPTTGCSRVSAGCDHCYAETLSLRYGWSKLPWLPENAEENVILHPERLDKPAKWRGPRMIFVNSMSDLFHPRVPGEFINEVWMTMYNNPRHIYQILTKRPKRLRDWTIRAANAKGWPVDEIWPDWMWVGTSIESREFVDRADVLRETPATVRFISAEPLLGPLLYDQWNIPIDKGAPRRWNDHWIGPQLDLTGISWLIVGGESGAGFRPMQVEWVHDLRRACLETQGICLYCDHGFAGGEPCRSLGCNEGRVGGTAFFFKQDCGFRSGRRGRFTNEVEWPQEMPKVATRVQGVR